MKTKIFNIGVRHIQYSFSSGDPQQKDPNANIKVISSTEEFGNLITTLKNDSSN
ncbi:hypothetical protein [Methanotorris formicicus]|uniref:Uncharacterized protein n=1 Tax=Methanotorris formicicus Mc-S-70 TaxID=647171 RepID=H1KYI7_9EURY|nr:hypothetical protein [Methanotorris formicicus]EHP87027.1 hypothetical protein MetfoDRAFT_0860 [Methanotorris formicicus Mc-S-70]